MRAQNTRIAFLTGTFQLPVRTWVTVFTVVLESTMRTGIAVDAVFPRLIMRT